MYPIVCSLLPSYEVCDAQLILFDNGIVDLTGNSNEVTLPDYAQLVESNVPIDIF